MNIDNAYFYGSSDDVIEPMSRVSQTDRSPAVTSWRMRGRAQDLLEEVQTAEEQIHAAIAARRLTVNEIRKVESLKSEYTPIMTAIRHELAAPVVSYGDVSALMESGLRYLGRLDAITQCLQMH